MPAMNRFHCVAMSIASLAILACHGVEAAEGAGAAADEKLAEVVVTGSLISDPNRASSSPIVITTAQDLQQSGSVSIESALNQLPQFDREDRKSTRLNSSHGYISYAVFCLKKKKTTHRMSLEILDDSL